MSRTVIPISSAASRMAKASSSLSPFPKKVGGRADAAEVTAPRMTPRDDEARGSQGRLLPSGHDTRGRAACLTAARGGDRENPASPTTRSQHPRPAGARAPRRGRVHTSATCAPMLSSASRSARRRWSTGRAPVPDHAPVLRAVAEARLLRGRGATQQLLQEDDVPGALRLLRRAHHCLILVTDALHVLEHISPWEYMEVRRVLGHGAGSLAGFSRLRALGPQLPIPAPSRRCSSARASTSSPSTPAGGSTSRSTSWPRPSSSSTSGRPSGGWCT